MLRTVNKSKSMRTTSLNGEFFSVKHSCKELTAITIIVNIYWRLIMHKTLCRLLYRDYFIFATTTLLLSWKPGLSQALQGAQGKPARTRWIMGEKESLPPSRACALNHSAVFSASLSAHVAIPCPLPSSLSPPAPEAIPPLWLKGKL